MEERWDPTILHRLLPSECQDQEGLIPNPEGPRDNGVTSGHQIFLHHGPQEQLVAGEDVRGISPIYMAFTVGSMGVYEFLRMLYGLCNAMAMFQQLMQNCLGELNLQFTLIYLDNVIVYS